MTSFDAIEDGLSDPYTGGDEELVARFDRVVVAPGQTVAYLWAGLLRADDAGAEAAARELQAAPAALLAGLSDDEKRVLQNVGLPDSDLDGVPNAGDNCRRRSTPTRRTSTATRRATRATTTSTATACQRDGDGARHRPAQGRHATATAGATTTTSARSRRAAAPTAACAATTHRRPPTRRSRVPRSEASGRR